MNEVFGLICKVDSGRYNIKLASLVIANFGIKNHSIIQTREWTSTLQGGAVIAEVHQYTVLDNLI